VQIQFTDIKNDEIKYNHQKDLYLSLNKLYSNPDFIKVFKHIKEFGETKDDCFEISSLIIATDGFATFPTKEQMFDIPTLWIILEYKEGEQIIPPHGLYVHVNGNIKI
jgi:hypothetical protein